METFCYGGRKFYLNGEPFQIISGAMHYFRTLPDCWEDRLKKLKACGFNTVETYTCWNLHERKEGRFDFSGLLDLVRFIETAKRLGLYVILRPGPYICAEWEFGGLPSWLLSYKGLEVRCNDPLFVEKCKNYLAKIFSLVRPHLITNGGNIIMMQVENEYGSYGNDKEYLNQLRDFYVSEGIDVLLFTSDGCNQHWFLTDGAIDGILPVGNFGSNAKQSLPLIWEYVPDAPLMCGEFWCGWFDHWYEDAIVLRGVDELSREMEAFFDMDASFNVYMFHGGTNFGFWNGANHTESTYQPTVTSYDYRAPLSEAGDTTPLYYALKALIERRTGVKAPDIEIQNSPKRAYGTLTLDEGCELFDLLDRISTPVPSRAPMTMEDLGQDFGFVLYTTYLKGPREKSTITVPNVRDRAIVFVDGVRQGVVERTRRADEMYIEIPSGEERRVDVLVENMGRVNYGAQLRAERKGAVDGICVFDRLRFGWENRSLSMENLEKLQFEKGKTVWQGRPMFLRGTLTVEGEPCDTFLQTDGFEKGFVLVNGFNIGRYFNSAGPQRTLYVPAALLREGENEIVVFESDNLTSPTVTFLEAPILTK